MIWPFYFFLDTTTEFFKNGPRHPDVFNANDLQPFFRNDHPVRNDVNGALAEYMFYNQVFRGIIEKIPVVKNVCYTDFRLNLYKQTLDFELKTWIPFWIKDGHYNFNTLLTRLKKFLNLKNATQTQERFFVQLVTLVNFSKTPKFPSETNRLEEVLFDLLYIYDLQNKRVVYLNNNLLRNSDYLSSYRLEMMPKACFQYDALYNSLNTLAGL